MRLLYVKHYLEAKNTAEVSNQVEEKVESIASVRTTYIEFANVLKVLVERLHHVVDELEQGKLVHILINVDSNDKVKRGIPSVDDFVLAMFEEGALLEERQILVEHQ